VSIADAGTVLCGEEVHAEIAAEAAELAAEAGASPDDLVWESLKPRELKDIGKVILWHVGRSGVGSSEERRSGNRWRRLSDMSAELASLRERGERVIGAIGASSASPGAGLAAEPGSAPASD
jgi:hypothetical protein